MSEYLFSVIAVSAVVALGGLLRYGGVLDKAASAGMALILLCVTVTPIVKLVGSISSFSDGELFAGLSVETPLEKSEYYGTAKEAFCGGVEEYVCEEFSLNADEVSVAAFDFDIQKMCAGKILIKLRGGVLTADTRAIKSKVESAGLGRCEVELEFS